MPAMAIRKATINIVAMEVAPMVPTETGGKMNRAVAGQIMTITAAKMMDGLKEGNMATATRAVMTAAAMDITTVRKCMEAAANTVQVGIATLVEGTMTAETIAIAAEINTISKTIMAGVEATMDIIPAVSMQMTMAHRLAG